MMNAARMLALAGAAALATMTSAALAQTGDFPNKPIRLMVPEVPDSATGILAAILAPKLADALGQKVEIVNMFGAPGLETGAKAAADGYTITYGSAGTLALLPHIDKTIHFDSFNDFAPVSLYAINPTLLATNPALPVANVKELIALMKAKPHQLKMSTAGAGTAGHFAGVLFNAMTGVDSDVVHYKGGGPAITAVIDGDAQWTFAPIAGRLPHVRTGKLKALATGGTTRLAVLPDVPTVAEAGVPGYNSVGWAGIFAPKGTPDAVIAKLNAAVVKAVADADLKAKVVEQGSEPMSSTAAELGKRLREEYDTLGQVAKTAGMAK
jgi:tripartite-type tricarboxylate transporter receptor subunit TctC